MSSTRNTIGLAGPTPKKALGQHWLEDETSLLAMLQAAQVGPDDTVLEVGPGLGTLTKHLVRAAKQVVAVEFDEVLARDLPVRVPADNLRLVQQDILRFDLTKLPADYKVVANIPYYLTSNLVRVLSESANPPSRVALLVQKEVAERIAAKPGDMSVLSVTAQFYWQVSLGRVVDAELFIPPPKVDSQIVSLTRRLRSVADMAIDPEPKLLFRLVKAGFGERRKTLRNALSGGMHLTKDQTEALLHQAHIDPGLRAQTLTMEQWHQLYAAYLDKYLTS
jgi:16S rRNA (adenine1518-N6/adenine1519-N6)-dimethyltransferase